MEYLWQVIVERFLGRLDGPLHFRFIFQPLMAIIFAIIDGYKDAKYGKPVYLWEMVSNPGHRKELIKDGWKHVGKIFIIASILDIVYSLKVYHTIFPFATLMVAFILAILPYVALRGPANRLIRLFKKK